MYEPVESTKTNNLPSKRKFARTFRILSRISFWVHIILGTVSAVTLFLVIFSRGSNNNSGVGIGTFIFLPKRRPSRESDGMNFGQGFSWISKEEV